MDNSDKIVSEARKWLGTPWRHNQRSLGLGVDCVQLVLASLEALHLDTGKVDNYYRVPEGESLKVYMQSLKILKEVTTLKPACILLFRLRGVPHHVAITTSATTMIHASNSRGVVEHSIGNWSSKIASIFEVVTND